MRSEITVSFPFTRGVAINTVLSVTPCRQWYSETTFHWFWVWRRSLFVHVIRSKGRLTTFTRSPVEIDICDFRAMAMVIAGLQWVLNGRCFFKQNAVCCLQVNGNVADDTLRRKRLRNRWYKMVTLVNNPSLVFERLTKRYQEELQLPGIGEDERFRHKATTSVAFIPWWRTYMCSVTLFRLNFADECEVIESRVWSRVTYRWWQEKRC